MVLKSKSEPVIQGIYQDGKKLKSNEGIITFSAPSEEIKFDLIKLITPYPDIPIIKLKTTEENILSITFHVENLFSQEDAKSKLFPILEILLNLLVYLTRRPIGEPYFQAATLPLPIGKKSINGLQLKGSHMIMFSSEPRTTRFFGGKLTPGPEFVKKLENHFQKSIFGNICFKMYRLAVNQQDTLGKFMLLYSVMLQLTKNELQDEVDKLILNIEPNVKQTPKPPKLKKRSKVNPNETIFTRLRNEIAHRRANVDIKNTSEEIKKNINDLDLIVIKILGRYGSEKKLLYISGSSRQSYNLVG
jgi:hypothetical protein